jgi:hypothetical protein
MANFADAADREVDTHERTFQFFVQLVYVGVMHIASFLVALAIGGVQGHWGAAFLVMIVATAVAIFSLARETKAAMAIVLAASLGILALAG